MTYVQTHFENLLRGLKGTLQSEQFSEDQREVVLLEEQTRAIIVPLHQVLRRDLPPDMRATIMEKFNTALSQYSDFAYDNPSQTDERNVDEEMLIIMNNAEYISATIKKSVVSNFSTNLENMYQSGKRFKKAVDITLKLLLKLHLQPQKERDKRKRIEKLNEGVDKAKIGDRSGDIITRNKARSHKKSNAASYFEVDRKERELEQVIESDDEVNISVKRLYKLKGILKTLLYKYDSESIDKRDIDISDISDEEFSVCATLFSFLKPYFSCPDKFRWTLSGQIPFVNLSNILLEAAGYKKQVKKVCPRPRPASLLSLPLDTAMLFTILSNFEGTNFNILCKDGVAVTSNLTAPKQKNDVFGSIFNLDDIQSFCKSRKLNFIHRVVIRPGMTTCILVGSCTAKTAASNTKTLISKQSVKKITDEEKKLLEVVNAELSMLNLELLEKKKNFSLEAKDKEIREMKKKRNILLDREARKKILDVIKQKKDERWKEYVSFENVKSKLKAKRSQAYPSTAAVIDDRVPATNLDLLPSFEDSTFTGTDYGLKTMSVTVPVSKQMFETHINLCNEVNIGEQL
ncbi:hypothetical protein MFLAVUS_010781 [Mucor flavus]|uniref:Uncharacterized protein n=1 Tax=Mucor flavus TaxID=439312 RepID=A0ABP9ZDN5_9FUNG